jgi:hypothetical protein
MGTFTAIGDLFVVVAASGDDWADGYRIVVDDLVKN